MKKFNKILDVNISKTKVVFNLDDEWKFRISILTNDIIDFSLYYKNYVEAKNYIIDRKKLRYQKFKLSKKINKKYNIYTERIKIIIGVKYVQIEKLVLGIGIRMIIVLVTISKEKMIINFMGLVKDQEILKNLIEDSYFLKRML